MPNSLPYESEVRQGLKLSAEQQEWLRTLYLAEVQLVDEQIGYLLDYLSE